jgi:hypothetical protein
MGTTTTAASLAANQAHWLPPLNQDQIRALAARDTATSGGTRAFLIEGQAGTGKNQARSGHRAHERCRRRKASRGDRANPQSGCGPAHAGLEPVSGFRGEDADAAQDLRSSGMADLLTRKRLCYTVITRPRMALGLLWPAQVDFI